jgi:hypothetical protein
MKEFAYNAVNTVWKIFWGILILPFVIPAFLVVKLLGGNTFSLDDMGIGFMLTILIAIGLAIAAASFAIGYFI